MKIRVGDILEMMHHRLRVKRIYKCVSRSGFTKDRVSLSCRPDCCNIPNGLVIDCDIQDVELFGKVWRFKESWDRKK